MKFESFSSFKFLIVVFLIIVKFSSAVLYIGDINCNVKLGAIFKCANINVSTEVTVNYSDDLYDYPVYYDLIIEHSNIPIMPKFAYLDFILHLSLIDCGIKIINGKNFEDVRELKDLDLNCNKVEKLETSTFKSLSNLETLNLANNRIAVIEVDVFLPLVKLKTLNISHNNLLVKLDFNTFKGPKNLTSIDLSHNHLTYIYSKTFIFHKNLIMLNLSKNSLVNLEFDTFEECANLEFMNLSNNRLTHLYSNTFVFQKKLKSLDLSSNFLVTLEFDVFNGPENLEFIDLSNNRLAHLYPETFALHKGSKILNLSSNFLTRLDANIFESNNKTTDLDLSNNMIQTFNFLKHLCNIQHLNLRNCSLTGNLVEEMSRGLENPQKCVKNTTESQGPLLETLDLSFNHIQSVNLTILLNMHNLRSLNIHSNNITNIPYNEIIENNPNFSEVVLSDNAWNCTYLNIMMIKFTQKNVKIKRKSSIVIGTNLDQIGCIDCSIPLNLMNSQSCIESSNDLVNVEKTTFFPTVLTSTTETEEHFSSTLENLEAFGANYEFVTGKQSTLVVGGVQMNNQQSLNEYVDSKFNYIILIILPLLIVILIFIVAFSIFHIRSYCLKRTKRYSEERAVCIFKKQFI